jgi:hypothetical protein
VRTIALLHEWRARESALCVVATLPDFRSHRSSSSGARGSAQFAPGTLFGLRRVESKVLAAPVVMDSKSNGKLYLSSISLARFEENAGKTNTSLVRLEGHAAYGVERTAAAIRIASS